MVDRATGFPSGLAGLHLCQQVARAAGNSRLVYDHAVPLKLWIGKILNDEKLSLVSFRRVMANWFHVRIITREENQLLNALKLGSSMPDDWDGHDVEARYRKAGIEF